MIAKKSVCSAHSKFHFDACSHGAAAKFNNSIPIIQPPACTGSATVQRPAFSFENRVSSIRSTRPVCLVIFLQTLDGEFLPLEGFDAIDHRLCAEEGGIDGNLIHDGEAAELGFSRRGAAAAGSVDDELYLTVFHPVEHVGPAFLYLEDSLHGDAVP